MRPRASLAGPRLPRAVASVLLLVGLALACAGRRHAEETPRPSPTAVPTPPPAPTPTPVPPALACASDAECALTPFGRQVTATAGCYCPTCPVPRNAVVAVANEESWQRLCGAAWAEREGCQAPMCPRPLAPACTGGACLDAGTGR
jgi:hypothetical protein